MEWCRDFKFQMIRLEWERIFLHFEIESNYPGPEQPKFVLARFQRAVINQKQVLKKGAEPILELQNQQQNDSATDTGNGGITDEQLRQ